LGPLAMNPPTEQNCCGTVVRVWSRDGKPLAGPKTGLSCGPAGAGAHGGHALHGTDELKVTPGDKYWLDAYMIPPRGKLLSDDQVRIQPRDISARIYGEPEPGAMPTISNLRVEFVTDSTVRLSWVAPIPAKT